MSRREKQRRRSARKVRKQAKRERQHHAKPAVPTCPWCDEPKTQRPDYLMDPFGGWWVCEPCQATAREWALIRYAAQRAAAGAEEAT